jgi:hypothetical protein
VNLNHLIKSGLLHGSPQRGLEVLRAADGGTLATDSKGRVLTPGKTVFATESSDLAIFWSLQFGAGMAFPAGTAM